MHEIFTMLLAVFDRAALMLICLFFLIRIRLFRELLHKTAHSPKELLAVTAIFSLFALFSTWSGVQVEGSLVNVRIIAVMSGGILFGPWVGIITGVIAGTHRYLIDIGGVTAVPCFITSIVAGILSGWINIKIPKAQRWRVGIIAGILDRPGFGAFAHQATEFQAHLHHLAFGQGDSHGVVTLPGEQQLGCRQAGGGGATAGGQAAAQWGGLFAGFFTHRRVSALPAG